MEQNCSPTRQRGPIARATSNRSIANGGRFTPRSGCNAVTRPAEYLLASDGTRNNRFRLAMRGFFPVAFLARQDKIGFATPERHWLGVLRPWVEKTLRSETARQIPAINAHAMIQDWQCVSEGKKAFDFRIWRWVNFIRWVEHNQVSFDDSSSLILASNQSAIVTFRSGLPLSA